MNEEEMIINENGEVAETAAETTAEIAVEPTVEELLEAAQTEAAKNLDGWQRALADLSNARKRFEKQSQLAHTNATVDVVSKLLPALDDFDRAMQNVPAEIAGNSWFDGLNGVLRKLNSILEGINAERIPTQGEPFDPNLHDAIMSEESAEYESGIIIRELQAGYRIGERVIRPSLVVVAS
jgi:molecular chaperone GrpE